MTSFFQWKVVFSKIVLSWLELRVKQIWGSVLYESNCGIKKIFYKKRTMQLSHMNIVNMRFSITKKNDADFLLLFFLQASFCVQTIIQLIRQKNLHANHFEAKLLCLYFVSVCSWIPETSLQTCENFFGTINGK